MKWENCGHPVEHKKQRLVSADGEILARIEQEFSGEWRYGMRVFVTDNAARKAAERDAVKNDKDEMGFLRPNAQGERRP